MRCKDQSCNEMEGTHHRVMDILDEIEHIRSFVIAVVFKHNEDISDLARYLKPSVDSTYA